ncbi:MAG: hypothetical protein R3258_03375 [Acidimicrobiia bacterium]|nr:hypothetical protein [Acidimicrobiia bacterium]
MIDSRAIEAIEHSDTDELLRVIDGYTESGMWQKLVELRMRCREAVTRGKQLWGVEEHIRYRLALEAPAQFAGPVVTEGAARFALGPLAEVAASTKTWDEMAPHLDPGPERSTFAAERVIRGDRVDEPLADVPGVLLAWEPAYPTATYKPDKVQAPSPRVPNVEPETISDGGERVGDPESEGALYDLVQAWTEESNGKAEVVSVAGSAEQAIRHLGLTSANVAEIDSGLAIAWMAWAAASGGAHGRRRGAAAGRYGAWWVLATIFDLDWPVDPDILGNTTSRLRWLWFDDGAPATGWSLRIAVEDPSVGLSWAVSAIDAATETSLGQP